MERTEREQQILDRWPTVTGEDIRKLNDGFSHYLFFRRTELCGVRLVTFYASCCGAKFEIPEVRRTEYPWEAQLLADCRHNLETVCPKCGRSVTVKDLAKAGKRKNLRENHLVMLLHSEGEALYADALSLWKHYETEADLTAPPEYWCASGYRFARGEVMQIDHQGCFHDDDCITWERERLGRQKWVNETFLCGSISWYHHEPYAIVGREAVTDHPFFRWCGYFDRWQRRERSGDRVLFDDFVSYLTVYCIYPRQMEMLTKAELFEPVDALVYDRKKFASAFSWEEPDPRKAFDLKREELRYFLAVQPPMDTLTVRNYVRRHWGKSWGLPFCIDFYNLWGGDGETHMEVLRFLRKYRLDPDRFLRYIGGVYEGQEDYMYKDLFACYRDYLDAAYQAGWCLEDIRILWPEQLFEAHDRATEEAGARLEAKADADQSRSLTERQKKYEFQLDGLRILMPMSTAAIRREGKALSHCVGGYADRHLKNVLTILFLRKDENPYTPYVTIEMDGNRLVQIHGYKNEGLYSKEGRFAPDPRKVHKQFLDSWLAWLKRGSPRDDIGAPVLLKKKKTEEVGIA